MARYSFLLRVLLSASLILNGGSGWAVPASHFPDGTGGANESQLVSPGAATIAASQLPCHGDEEHHAAESAVQLPETSTLAADTNDSGNDCCESGVCECGCLHQGGFAFAALWVRMSDTHDPQSPLAFAHEHVAPMLAHLIRPPIG